MVPIFVWFLCHVAFTKAQDIGPMPAPSISMGCRLNLNTGYDEMEPVDDPLVINVRIRIFAIRDIPDSGGSFGVNTKYDFLLSTGFLVQNVQNHI